MKKKVILFLFVGISRFTFASSVTVPEVLKSVERESDWSMVGAIATCLAALTGIAAVFVYWKALKENQKLSKFTSKQIEKRNSDDAFLAYLTIIDTYKSLGEKTLETTNNSTKIAIKTLFYQLSKSLKKASGNNNSTIIIDLDRNVEAFNEITEYIKIDIINQIDNNSDLIDAHKLSLILKFGMYSGFEILHTDKPVDFLIKFKDGFVNGFSRNKPIQTAKYLDVYMQSTDVYKCVAIYTVLRNKYFKKLNNENNKII